ncbi:MAG: hypothetical protein H0V71_05580 [Chloroflexi bacterium]|nr:hypothetical protein [Chloroflexota bacterium]
MSVLYLLALILLCLAIEVGFVWCVGAMGFDLFGWHYPARLALVLATAGVLVVTLATCVMEIWESREPPVTIEELIARGQGALVNHDDYGKLWTIAPALADEELRIVEVVNTTPDRDGSYSRHFLRVPPSVRSAREAVAWTFGFESADEYVLAVES